MKFLTSQLKTIEEKIKSIMFFFIFSQSFSYANIHLSITEGISIARPIGITPFTGTGPELKPEDTSNIIANDLQNSGKFNPVQTSLKNYNNHAELVKFSAEKNIDFIIFGSITYRSEEKYMISYQLMDTVDVPGNIIVKNNFIVEKKWLRNAAHRISNEIFETLTGIRGAFHTRIAYISKKHAPYPYELCVADYDGKQEFIIRKSQYPIMSPTWSPDGTHIAYVIFENHHSSLVIQTLSTGRIKVLVSFPQHNGAPKFSPDSKKLAFVLSKSGSLNIYVMDILSGYIHQITNTPRSNNTEPSWFPDSQNISYTSDQTGQPHIYKLDISSGESTRLTWEGIKNQNSNISFDGKFFVAVSIQNGMQNIIKQDLETGIIKKLTYNTIDETPTLSPNGVMMICSSIYQENSILQLVSTDGRFKKYFTDINKQIKFPSWSPYL